MSFETFLVDESKRVSDALIKIEANTMGCVFITNREKAILGIATDGDIRRFLISGNPLESPVHQCMNKSFVKAHTRTPRENILKLLDHRIQIVPILDDQGRLVDIVTRKSFPLRQESVVVARSKSPVRVSFGGGGSDLTHYFVENGGAVMNATITMYTHCSLRKREDQKITIHSLDLKKVFQYENFSDLCQQSQADDRNLIAAVIRLIEPGFGFDLQLYSDFPMGSGLGGSAAVLSSVIGCFNQFREDRWDNYEISEIAFQAERIFSEIAGGWQDQYATVFGGFNFMEFTDQSNLVHPLKLSPEVLLELQENLIFGYVGGVHHSGDIHKGQKSRFDSDPKVRELVAKNKEITYRQKNLLLRGNLDEFGHTLHETWELKRQLSEAISTPEIDQLYQMAKNAGAHGGKLLGAGGGGFLLFYVDPKVRFGVQSQLAEKGVKLYPLNFEDKGLQAWSVRQS